MRHRGWAVFFVLILFSTIQGLIVALEFNALLKPEAINKILAEAKIYENLPEIIQAINEEAAKQNPEQKTEDIQNQIMIEVLTSLLEPATIKKEVEKNTYLLTDYLNNKRPLSDVSFDLRDLKKNVEKNLPAIISENLKDLPPQQGSSANLSEAILKSIPFSFSLSEIKNSEQTFAKVKLTYKLTRFSPWIFGGLSLFLLLILAYWGRSSKRTIFKWWSISLLLPAGSYLIFCLLGNLISEYSKTYTYSQLGAQVNQTLIAAMMPFFDAINQNTLPVAYLYSGILFGLGLLFLIISFFFPKPLTPPSVTPGKNL